jgi:hypothetical protein
MRNLLKSKGEGTRINKRKREVRKTSKPGKAI